MHEQRDQSGSLVAIVKRVVVANSVTERRSVVDWFSILEMGTDASPLARDRRLQKGLAPHSCRRDGIVVPCEVCDELVVDPDDFRCVDELKIQSCPPLRVAV
jgi:hypothetical protein